MENRSEPTISNRMLELLEIFLSSSNIAIYALQLLGVLQVMCICVRVFMWCL